MMKGQGFGLIARILMILVLYTLYPIPYTLSYAETLSSADLIERAKELDGKPVVYKGEAVTAILNRGEYSWINLNDGKNAIGVWCRSADSAFIKFTGDYKNKGDIVEVEGVFNRACPMHGGELDIHANRLNIAETGYLTREKLNPERLNFSIVLFLIIIIVVFVFRKRL